MNKKGFLDMEVLTSAGFVILVAMAVSATVIGYVMSRKWGLPQVPMWQLVAIILAEVAGSYIFAARG